MGDQVAFCPSCGRQARAAPHRDEYVPPAHVPTVHRKDGERDLMVLIAVIVSLVVVLPLVLAMILYIGIIGFDTPDDQPVTTTLTRTVEAGTYRFTFGPFSERTSWDDITIVLSDMSSIVSWSPDSSALEGAPPCILEFLPMGLGAMTVFCNVTDSTGDGLVGAGDYFTLSTGSSPTFSATITYNVQIIHESTGTSAASNSFTPS